jgi:hypothetical protein
MTSDVKNKTYSSVQDEIEALNVSKKNKLIALLLAIFSALFIVIGPIILFANLLMFTNLQVAFSLAIAVFVILFMVILDVKYLHLVSQGQIEGLCHVWVVDLLYITIVVFAVYFILAKLVFKLM